MASPRAWSFHNPVRIECAPGALQQLPRFLGAEGELLLVTSRGFRERGGLQRLTELVQRPMHVVDDVEPNPGLAQVEAQLEKLAGLRIGTIVAVGGGSVLDTAKILAAVSGGVPLREHLLSGAPLPPSRASRLICVPTTAGTGSEVTPFATVWNHETKKKHSVSGETLFPDVALLDPELTLSVPEDVTLSTGLDAITQAFEAAWSRRANPLTTAFAVRAIRAGLRALPALIRNPGDVGLRQEMLEASVLAGLAISHTRTTLCHSISYPLTAHFGVPHGYACAFTLGEVFDFNQAADPALFEELANGVGFSSADALRVAVEELRNAARVGPTLRRYVDDVHAVAALVPEMLTPGRADNNLRAAAEEDVAELVARAAHACGMRSV
ncbi:MAG TPA: phosphonoacetaldehyde reductase [Thermoanaerobaculia bacterium]|jgi:alcohol dehydrogenase